MGAAAVESDIYFLRRSELYDEEKPYSLRFNPVDETFPRANILLDKHATRISDIRGQETELLFEKDGLAIMPFETKMEYEDFDDDGKVREIYLREVADHLRDFLGAAQVQIFEHTVRKRHETFPISTGEPYRWNQPTTIAHVDTTLPWAMDMARSLNRDKPDGFLDSALAGRVQCVNIWKPLRGPVMDWPLAMCAAQTVDPMTDFEPCDLVYPDYVVENRQVYRTESQEWFYLSAQQPSEAWIFLQSDTKTDRRLIAHTSFLNPLAKETDQPRESIEVRALVFFTWPDA